MESGQALSQMLGPDLMVHVMFNLMDDITVKKDSTTWCGFGYLALEGKPGLNISFFLLWKIL